MFHEITVLFLTSIILFGSKGESQNAFKVTPLYPNFNPQRLQEYYGDYDFKDSKDLDQFHSRRLLEFPVISNLNELFKPFASAGCYISINNFRQVNIPHDDVPLVIWSPEWAHITIPPPLRPFETSELLWMAKELYKMANLTVIDGKILC